MLISVSVACFVHNPKLFSLLGVKKILTFKMMKSEKNVPLAIKVVSD